VTWNAGAASLGLTLMEPIATFERGASFSRLKRAMGGPALPPPRFQQWMYGKRNGVEVIVLMHHVTDGIESTSWTHAIARIDPPLFAGMQIGRRMSAYVPPIGEPRFDAMCHLTALAPACVAPIFRDDALHDALGRLFGWHAEVTDGTVDAYAIHGQGGPPPDLSARIDVAVDVAKKLAALRARASPLPGEEQRIASWRAFADTARLDLDRDRMVLTGDVGGARVRIGIEGEPTGLQTVLVADFPQPLGIGLVLTRQSSLQALAELFAPTDIRVGDKVFDDLFLIRGNPERVRWTFARNEVRHALVELCAASREVRMDDARLVVRWPMPVDDAPHLEGIVHRVRTIATALFPTPGKAPYR